MDILGTIGGLYEILYIAISVFLKRFTEVLLDKDIRRKMGNVGKGWFTYSTVIKQGRKVHQEVNEERKGLYKGKNIIWK